MEVRQDMLGSKRKRIKRKILRNGKSTFRFILKRTGDNWRRTKPVALKLRRISRLGRSRGLEDFYNPELFASRFRSGHARVGGPE